MNICKNCSCEFRSLYVDENGKRIDLRKREYCLTCNPFGKRTFWRGKRVEKTADGKRLRTKTKNEKKTRICKSCNKEYTNVSNNLTCSTCLNKATRKKRKEKAYEILGNKCNVCGYDRCSSALDIHHKYKESKTLTFACSWGLSWKKLEKELDKCILLCSNCHRELHAGLKQYFGGAIGETQKT